MTTQRLYYEQPYLNEFDAQVVSCDKVQDGFAVILNKTAFYPEGGGQSCDFGTLGGANVLDVQIADDEIVHLCDKPLSGTVCGRLDWARRFDLMQQHSGEHLVSGLVHRKFGYHNVGFHMGADVITIDFDGMIDPDSLSEIEQKANESVWANLETEIFCPDEQTLKTLSYRSKKPLSGWVRLVRFPGIDLCACCGTHVARTGEIGLIKLLSCVKFHEGVRIEMVCGKRAFAYLSSVWEQNRRISGLLSAKPLETAQEVARVLDETARIKYRMNGLQDEIFTIKAESYRGAEKVVLFEDGMTPDNVRKLCTACMDNTPGLCAVFSGADGDYKYCIGQENGDVRELVKRFNELCCGRGGGKPSMAQGSCAAVRSEIDAFFEIL